MKNLAAILSHLMAEKEIRSAELARKTGVGQPVIYRLMNGVTDNPQVLTLKPIADFFDISLDQLLGLKPLTKHKSLDNESLPIINNKLTTIKAIGSVLAEILPTLIDGYKKSVEANLIKEEISTDILPLLPLNTINLLKAINQLQELLITDNILQD